MDHSTRIASVRHFSRFYTKRIGLLSDGFLDSPYSLTQARVVYEIAHRGTCTAAEVAHELELDPGYLSRILRGLERTGLITKRRSGQDRRRLLVELSREGHRTFEKLNSVSRSQISALLSEVDAAGQDRIVDSMHVIENELGARTETPPRVSYRPHGPGDMGWIVQRHGELYARTHGWDQHFEAMVADIVAKFLERYDPACERSWIAEVDGRRAGAIALVRRSKTIGQLRLFFVDPSVRGMGIGGRLVSECVGHARHVGYKKMVLSTVRSLAPARRLYEREGFQLTQESPEHAWGKDHIVQHWELKL